MNSVIPSVSRSNFKINFKYKKKLVVFIMILSGISFKVIHIVHHFGRIHDAKILVLHNRIGENKNVKMLMLEKWRKKGKLFFSDKEC